MHRFSSEVHNHLQCVHIQVATVLKCQPLDLTSTCRHITVLDEVDVCCVICNLKCLTEESVEVQSFVKWVVVGGGNILGVYLICLC